ncbi:family 1 encapsulin nanocompartment shell protein [uncultured Sunxiuqinia sp.]|uniref:family 1 encapsulin nanocompartment shell protein n=1 Tax=uncultured Sunxiuqinia sp. TaxID=1573825 RepID=UPI002AA76B83|nr:family 1 encapsulin nanocompartment shell protein [uncultured Sunxiuqinia sp.]
MNILKKSIAPITDKAWEEISDRTNEILKTYLTGRKFIDIDGPNGLEMGGVSTGRLVTPEKQTSEGINYGIREVLPFVENRKPFELDVWELDNIERGAKDVDLSPLEDAVKEVAFFEEKVIYKGFSPIKIKGLEPSAKSDPVDIPDNTNAFLKELGRQVLKLSQNGVEGPYSLVINAEQWLNLIKLSEGYPISMQLKEILGGNVIVNQSNEHSFLVSERGGDYELIQGQDITLGYDSHDTEKVKLYLTASFTFRVISPEAIVVFKSKKKE